MVDIYIKVVCNFCAKEIEADFQGHEIIVTPCESCLENERTEGYNERDGEE